MEVIRVMTVPVRHLIGCERQLSAQPHPKECTRVFISTAAAAHMNDSGKQEHRSELTSDTGSSTRKKEVSILLP